MSTTSANKARLLEKHDDDVVIVAAVRTAITKAKKGGFKDTSPTLLLSSVLRAAYTRASLPSPALIDDICVGNVLPPGGGATAARMAALHAGIPVETSVSTVNRQCSSGLAAVGVVVGRIRSGEVDIGIGAGVESMTHGYGAGALGSVPDEILTNKDAEDCLLPMGITSENVAKDWGISREVQDAFAAQSFQKAAAANKAGKFRDEIVPVKVTFVDPKTEKEMEVVVDQDDGIRDGVTVESLAKLKPAFAKDGSTHAGNASQVSDGAAAVLLARRSVAKRLGLPILGKYVAASTIGVPPRVMGIGPAFAIPKVLKLTGLSIEDVDFFEINEAFASQAVMSVQHLKIPEEKVNVNGGAIAIGHPLGCTGARQVATALSIGKQTGGRVFVTSMCIGSGMGMAAVFVNEQ